MAARQRKTARPVRVEVSKEALLESLLKAAKQKGETPISIDADKKRYGLYGKWFYLREFGSWNAAVRAAGLPVNEWNRRQREAAQMQPPRQNKQQEPGETMEQFIERRIAEEKREIAFLEELLRSYHSGSRAA